MVKIVSTERVEVGGSWEVTLTKEELNVHKCTLCTQMFKEGEEVYVCDLCKKIFHRNCSLNGFGEIQPDLFPCNHHRIPRGDEYPYFCGRIRIEN